jgi:hypothetical protein
MSSLATVPRLEFDPGFFVNHLCSEKIGIRPDERFISGKTKNEYSRNSCHSSGCQMNTFSSRGIDIHTLVNVDMPAPSRSRIRNLVIAHLVVWVEQQDNE